MPPPQGRRPLRARRRHPQHGRCRPFSRTPEPRTRAPAWMGELLRGSGPWTYRRGGTARPAHPPSARRERNDARLRRGHERVAQMRRGVQPRARILLPSFPPFGGAADRGRMGLPVRSTAELRPRELDRPRGCRVRPSRPGRQRGRRRAGEGLAGPVRERKDRSPVRLRRRLRPRQGAAGTGESAVPDPRPFAGGSLLPRRPEQADRWTWLVLAAYTQLRLARVRVADLRLPWERRYDAGRLTPIRVHRAVSMLLVELGTPAKPPKPCGRSPGR